MHPSIHSTNISRWWQGHQICQHVTRPPSKRQIMREYGRQTVYLFSFVYFWYSMHTLTKNKKGKEMNWGYFYVFQSIHVFIFPINYNFILSNFHSSFICCYFHFSLHKAAFPKLCWSLRITLGSVVLFHLTSSNPPCLDVSVVHLRPSFQPQHGKKDTPIPKDWDFVLLIVILNIIKFIFGNYDNSVSPLTY